MPTRRTYVLTLTLLLVSSLAVALLSSRPAIRGAAGAAAPGVAPLGIAAPGAQAAFSAVLPIEEFSPAFLGVYRKVMEIEDEILEYAAKYGVDPALARAVCMYESGGNANLSSSAGAQGYFQVMGPTFRSLRVETNIEAGIKYLSQQITRFDREDYNSASLASGSIVAFKLRQYSISCGSLQLGHSMVMLFCIDIFYLLSRTAYNSHKFAGTTANTPSRKSSIFGSGDWPILERYSYKA